VVGLVHKWITAIRLAIAKPLQYQRRIPSSFKSKFTLRRDSRIKERRKYGLKKARKASQFSKR
jgi:small subunit ribosomal protein S9